MTYSQALLTRFKASNGGISDYQAAKMLGCTRQNISQIKNGKSGLSEDRIIMIAKAVGDDPEKALLRRLIEEAKTDEMREILEAIEAKLAS